MLGECVTDDGWHRHGPPACLCLGCTEVQMAGDFDDLFDDLHSLSSQIQAIDAQPEEFAGPESAIGTEKDHGPVSGMDGIGQAGHLDGGEVAHLVAFQAGQAH